ncbi:hypothetical protein Vadar_012267 [Vaccinium darrowii]|uniref:Uncharacterized protein n=1 Tax=Vaccinium darrowii TaxID=229202 RepID=A0ACB7XGZ8_9ERIC|nr:hypothetical protein Vadar_012267 [Vaccinium darrowii]
MFKEKTRARREERNRERRVMGRAYNLRVRREQQQERLSPPPSPDSPPSPRASHRRTCRRKRSKRPGILMTRHYLDLNGVPSPATQPISGLLPEAEVTRLPPPPPLPAAAEHADEIPVDISSEDEDQKPNINDPLSGLEPPPRVRRNASTIFVNNPLDVIAHIKSHLVSELLTLRDSEIKTMICSANRVFTVLDCYGDNYLSFYYTVRRFIEFSQELLVADTLRNEHCAVFEEVAKRYEDVVIEANNAEESLSNANMILEEAEKNVVHKRKRVEDLRSLLVKWELELKQDESEFVAQKSEVDRWSEIHSSIEVEVQRVGLEDEEAKKVFDEAKKRYEEASKGVALVKEELRSFRHHQFTSEKCSMVRNSNFENQSKLVSSA